jgi:hypothetical protein
VIASNCLEAQEEVIPISLSFLLVVEQLSLILPALLLVTSTSIGESISSQYGSKVNTSSHQNTLPISQTTIAAL